MKAYWLCVPLSSKVHLQGLDFWFSNILKNNIHDIVSEKKIGETIQIC